MVEISRRMSTVFMRLRSRSVPPNPEQSADRLEPSQQPLQELQPRLWQVLCNLLRLWALYILLLPRQLLLRLSETSLPRTPRHVGAHAAQLLRTGEEKMRRALLELPILSLPHLLLLCLPLLWALHQCRLL